MNTNRESESLDLKIQELLRGEYAFVSRRSFLSRITHMVLATTGVAVVTRVLPYMAPEALAAGGSGNECGRHGYECKGGCTGGAAGSFWQQCCDTTCDPVTKAPRRVCCKYWDYCGTRGFWYSWFCGGTRPSGHLWCTEGDYICTFTTCGTPVPAADCDTSCPKTC
jgi:hypothetical protein